MAGGVDLFDAYFKRADLDGDGQISGAEAVAFFQGSGLPKEVLAQVWNHADHRKAGYLGRQEFYNALKLVTVAQSKRDLTPEIVKAALYSPASAKIPAPQIKLAATPAPRGGPPASQLAGANSPSSQNTGMRPTQVPGTATPNQQFFPSQQNQLMRPPQPMPSSSSPNLQQFRPSQGMQNGAAPRPPTSNISTGWLAGSTGGPTSQMLNRTITPPATQDGFGLTTSGLATSIQPRPQLNTGQMPSTPPKFQDTGSASNQPATERSKSLVVSGNGFASDSLFGDVFSATPAQPKESSSSAVPSTTSLPVSSAIVPSSVGPQSSAKPSTYESLQNTYTSQPVANQSTGRQNQQVTVQSTAVPPTTGSPVGPENSFSNQSQTAWPKMSQSDIHKYIGIFMKVDKDRDGKITGEEARALFSNWKLPREVLKQVWDLSDQDNDSMLSLREFCMALYLMERYIEKRPLPTTLPSTVMSDETLLSLTSHPATLYSAGGWGAASGLRPPLAPHGPRPAHNAAARPPRPPTAPQGDEKPSSQQKSKVPVLEKHLVTQLSQEEQDSLNSKFEEATHADIKVGELEKEISESRQKVEFYRAKMQELIIYKSRCDNRLNEVTAKVSADRREAEALAKKYEEKCKQAGDVASKLTIEEATFRDIQEKKMELYRGIVKMEEGGTADGAFKDRAERIQSGLDELVKTVNERCKQYGLRAKPTSLVELPFGWQAGIQEGAADWDEKWDKFEDEGFTFVKELTLDVQNVLAPPKSKPSTVHTEATSTEGKLSALSSDAEKSEKVPEKESAHTKSENGVARSPSDSPAGKSPTGSQSHVFQDSPFQETAGADGSPHSKETKSDIGGAESVFSGDKSVDEPGWGTFDTNYDTESIWGMDSVGGKDMDLERHGDNSLFGGGGFGLNPIRTGPSREDNIFQGKGSSIFADSVPSTPAYNQGKSAFVFDSVPSTPAYNQGKSTFNFDSFPSTPAHSQGKSPFAFTDSVPSTPAYNQGNSSYAFSDSVPSTPAYNFGNSEDRSFDSFSRFDSFNMNDGGLFSSSDHSLSRFDSVHSTRDPERSYAFSSRFDSFREFRDSDEGHGFSRFDSFRDSDHTHGFSRFDSLKDSDQSHGFSRFDSFRDSDPSHGFPSRFDSFRESRDSDSGQGFTRFDSFSGHESGFFHSSGNSQERFDSVRGSRDSDSNHGFPSFDDADPFGSSGPFKTSLESETPRKSSDNWKAF